MKEEEIITLLPFYIPPPTIFISFIIKFYIIRFITFTFCWMIFIPMVS